MKNTCHQEAFVDFVRAAHAADRGQSPKTMGTVPYNAHWGSAPLHVPGGAAPSQVGLFPAIYKDNYINLNDGQQFWFFPTFIGEHSIAGFRWMEGHWVYMGFGLDTVR